MSAKHSQSFPHRGCRFRTRPRRVSQIIKNKDAPKLVYVKVYKRRTRPDGCYLTESTPVDASATSPEYTQKGRIWGYNSKCSFRLSSTGTSPWVLDEASVYDSPDYKELQKKTRESALASIPNSANYRNCLSIPITRVLNHPNFQLLSVSKLDATGDRFRMNFEVQGNDLVDGMTFDIRIVGSFDIDKNRSWSITDRSEAVYSAGVVRTTSSKFETTKIGDLHFLIKEHQANHVLANGTVTRNDQIDFSHTPSLSVSSPESEFTLSYYGFPEPVGVTWQRPTPRYIWWMLGVGGCALFAFLCRIVAIRIQRKSRPTMV